MWDSLIEIAGNAISDEAFPLFEWMLMGADGESGGFLSVSFAAVDGDEYSLTIAFRHLASNVDIYIKDAPGAVRVELVRDTQVIVDHFPLLLKVDYLERFLQEINRQSI